MDSNRNIYMINIINKNGINMNLANKCYKLWLLLRFRQHDLVEIYPLIHHLLKKHDDRIFHIIDDNMYVFQSPRYVDGYVFDDGIHKIFAGKRSVGQHIILPFSPFDAYDFTTYYDLEITCPQGTLFAGDKNTSVFTVTNSRRGLPRKIFKYMRHRTSAKNIINDVISRHIKYSL